MHERYEQLLSVVSKPERDRLEALLDAEQKSLQKYKENPSITNKKKWDVALKGLKALVDELWEKYFKSNSVVPEDRFLSNLMEACKWLQGLGYKIKKSTIYNARDKGLIFVWPDGRVYKADAELYARKHLVLQKSSDIDDPSTKDLEELQKQKLQAEVSRLKKQIEKYNFELNKEQNKYILKKDFYLEMAGRIMVLEKGLSNFFRSKAIDLIATVNGDQDKVGDFIEKVTSEMHLELERIVDPNKTYVVQLESGGE